MSKLITAIFSSIANCFDAISKCKEKQSETFIIKSKKKQSKAIEYAEKIIFLADKTDLKDDTLYKIYRKLFFKYN